jgi:hypothetical protein
VSYDIYLLAKDGLGDEATMWEVGNYTSNAGRMWAEALGYSLSDTHGRRAGDLIEDLAKAVAAMTCEPERFRPLEPPNGWGDLNGATKYLASFHEGCRRWPDTIVYVSV